MHYLIILCTLINTVRSGGILHQQPQLGNFYECGNTVNLQENGCGNITSHFDALAMLSCYTKRGRIIMASHHYQLYSAICDCKSSFQSVFNQFTCASGAYEDWISVQSSYPCIFAFQFPAACYRHPWRYSRRPMRSMRDAFQMCLSINDKIHRHACIHGAAYSFSLKYASLKGQSFPITMMCAVGNTVDRIMCIHGYWDGVSASPIVTSSTELNGLKKRICLSLREINNDYWEACMLRGIMDLSYDSPLFQSSAPPVTSLNTSQVSKLLLYGVNITLVDDFRRYVQTYGEMIPSSVVTTFYHSIGINALLYAVESTDARKGFCDMPLCHLPCHQVGRQLFVQVQSLEMVVYLCGKGCANGCFHGALRQWMEGMYQRVSANSITSVLRQYFKFFLENSTAYTVYGEDMFHALGHGLLENTANYSYKGAAECAYFPTRRLAYRCSQGFYMEYFKRHTEKLRPGLKLDPCDAVDVDFPTSCYEYLWERLDLAPTLSAARYVCMHASNHERDVGACLYGFSVRYGELFWGKNRTLPLADICSEGSPTLRKMCVYGIFGRRLGQFGLNASFLSTMCGALPVEYSLRQACLARGRDRLDEPNLSLFYYTAEMRQAESDNNNTLAAMSRVLATM